MRITRLATAAVLSLGVVLLGGCSSSPSKNATGCTPPPALQQHPQSYAHEPAVTISRTTYTAKIVTNCGTITVALDGKDAPHTVNSFAFLASKGYFNDTACLRLTNPADVGIAVLQCGDPTETGKGGPGYTLPDENLTGAKYPVGTVAMANSGPNTGGSQFFLIYGASQLQPNYTPFGQITSGLDILKRIAAQGEDDAYGELEGVSAGDGHPKQPVIIESFTVTKG